MKMDPFRITMKYLKVTGVLKIIVDTYPILNKISQDYNILLDIEF